MKAYSPTFEESESGDSVKRLRKSINTRISKIKRSEGNRQTHIKAIKFDLKVLNKLSNPDAKEMSEKVAREI